MRSFLIILLLSFYCTLNGQIYNGRVIDLVTKLPVSGAEVSMNHSDQKIVTDVNGYFNLITNIPDTQKELDYIIQIQGNKLNWTSKNDISFAVSNIIGQKAFIGRYKAGSNSVIMPVLSKGIYLISINYNNETQTYKWISDNQIPFVFKKFSSSESFHLKKAIASANDSIFINKTGYFSQKYSYTSSGKVYDILKTQYIELNYLDKLINIQAFQMVQGTPLTPTFGEVKSIKVIYSIPDKKIYYANSSKYNIHFDFCLDVLKYPKDHSTFNEEQYKNNPNRIYYLANLNRFTASDIYTLEFFPGDEIDCNGIKTVYDAVVASSFIENNLKLYLSNNKWSSCSSVPIISSDELYKGQNYQPLNPQENYGYIKKVDVDDVNSTYLGRHDIVLLNGIPMDISVVAGIITTEFQTPLSHINVLSHNRGTPNMALRDGWTNPKINSYIDKLVYFKVTLDSFYISEASLTEAQEFWKSKEPQTVHKLTIDTLFRGVVNINTLGVTSVNKVGGKVANMGELTKITLKDGQPLPVPEGVFAIPFYYYVQHIKKYGLDKYIDRMLLDTLFWKDASVREKTLDTLEDSIKKCPLDTQLARLVKEKLQEVPGFTTFRFRSSTNAEDIQGFNGAGLYDSYTGSLTDPDKPIDKAIKKTWGSLWNFQAFEEREYFKIDHRTVAMGVLINRSFPAEAANGVVITKNLFNEFNSAITINVQIGEISIVKPEENYLPDQILYYTFDNNAFEYINHSNVPGMEGKTVMTNEELKILKDLCMAIHYHYCRINFKCNPMDIEFKVDVVNGQRKIYIKQARLY